VRQTLWITSSVEKLQGIEPITRLFFNRYESTAPARKEELQISAEGAPAARRAPDVWIIADATQHSTGIPTEQDHTAKGSHAPKQHGPARKERNQCAPANDPHIFTNGRSEQRIRGEDGVFDPRARSLGCPIKHRGMIKKNAIV